MAVGTGRLARRGIFLVLGVGPVVIHVLAVWYDPLLRTTGAGLWHTMDLGLIIASGLPHTLIYFVLLAMFAASLRPRRDALITALARRMYGAIAEDMATYTRRVTWAWCFFFAAQLLTSLTLFLTSPIEVWSFFVSVLNLPLVALMFIVEQGLRPMLLRNAPRHSLGDVMRMIGHVTEGLSKARTG